MKNLLILGAGIEKTEGIDMPLANELVPKIRDFLYENETGIEVDKALRQIIKGLRFHYDDFVKKAVDKLASDFKKEVNIILREIKETLEGNNLREEDTKLAKIIISFLEKIQKLQEDVVLDDTTANLISEVFSDIQISDENIINLGKLSFSDTFDIVMKRVLEQSIRNPNHPVLKHVYKNLMDFENLLLKHFIGFYNNNINDIKKYLYISWTLWAYLIWKENEVYFLNDEVPLYSKIDKSINVITFNYTSFAGKYFSKAKYFHGNLKKYIRLDNRGECDIDNYDTLNIVEFIKEIVGGNIDFKKKKYVIPSIVPPLRLKPVLSNEFIDLWYHSVEEIREASRLIIVGYSFNYADEHFNDLIRKNKDKDIYIVNPSIKNLMDNLNRIYHYRNDDYSLIRIQNKSAYKCEKLILIEAYANEININELMEKD